MVNNRSCQSNSWRDYLHSAFAPSQSSINRADESLTLLSNDDYMELQLRPARDEDTYLEEIRTSAITDISHLADHSQGYRLRFERNRVETNSIEDNGRIVFGDTSVRVHVPNGSSRGSTRWGLNNNVDEVDAESIVDQKYEDFHTIDWQRDLARDRLRHKYVAKQRETGDLRSRLASLYDASAGWLCVLLVGLCAGAVAGVIDIGTEWMSNLKEGICADRFWLDKEHCCWSANDERFAHDSCASWLTWANIFHLYDTVTFVYKIVSFICYVAISVAMAALCAMLVKVFAPYACGSGIPEIKCILSGFIIRGYLGKWTFVIKSVGLMLAAASGLNLGKEGPMVHLASCCGNILSYLFPKYGRNEAKKREILSASAAAGVSVAFGAPIGGVLFSLEEASYYFPLKTMWRSFFCALVAGIVLKAMNPFGTYRASIFYVDYEIRWDFFELIPITFLGILGGLIGAFFIFCNIRWCKYRKTHKWLGSRPVQEVIIITLVTAALNFINPYTQESASELIKELFDKCGADDESDICNYENRTYEKAQGSSIGYNVESYGRIGPGIERAIFLLTLASLQKLILTIFTFGLKVPAGLFVPSLAIGACIGRVVGILMENMYLGHTEWFESCTVGKDCLMPGLYAIAGAAAVLGGVTRMTVSLVVIMFELTGSLQFIVPTMVAVMTAKWVGDAINKFGIYDAHITLNNYPFLDNKEEFTHNTYASDVMRPREGDEALKVLSQDSMSVGDIEQILSETDYNGFPVVVSTETQYLVGFVTRRDLKLAISNARKSQEGIVTQSTVLFSTQTPQSPPGSASHLRLRKLIDLAPITITDQTPMETVIDMFRKLGLRQCLVTHNGRLLGIITKKDVLKHLNELDEHQILLKHT